MTDDFSDIIDGIATAPADAGEYSQGLERVLNRFPSGHLKAIECEKGWYQIIVELDDRLSRICPSYEIYQIKQKYGVLRYRWGSKERLAPEMYQKMLDISNAYENLSKTVCEVTGEPGVLMVKDYWLKTLNPDTAPDGYELYDAAN